MLQQESKGHQISILDQSAMSRIRGILDRHGYADKAIDVLNRNRQAKADSPVISTADGTAATTLIKLFLHGVQADIEDLTRTLRPADVRDWEQAGLIQCENGQVTPLVLLMPDNGLLVASDKNWDIDAASRPDAVMGITNSSAWLSKLTVRRRSRRTLDLCTGTGIQAMLAARHSGKVIGVDINPRALAFARFNAELNGISNIEFIEGDLFAPVKDQKFDLILCSPPYIISPDFRCLYRDNPLQGDEFVQRIVRQIPRYLRASGYGQIICNWEQHAEQKWETRIADWIQQSGCDAWVLRGTSTESSIYAKHWLKDYSPSNTERLLDEWARYYEKKNIASIGADVITLRRSSADRNWLCVVESQPEILPGAGEYIEQGFQLRYFLNARQETEALLDERLRVTPHMLVDQQHESGPDGWRASTTRLTLTRGFGYSTQVAPQLIELVARCSGRQTLRELLHATATRLDKGVEEITPPYLEAIRKLIALGFLWPIQHLVPQAERRETKTMSAGNGAHVLAPTHLQYRKRINIRSRCPGSGAPYRAPFSANSCLTDHY